MSPVQRCTTDGKPGWSCGGLKCYGYTVGDDASELRAKKKAIAQCIAIGETPSAETVTAAADPVEPVTSAHLNDVVTRAAAKALKLEKKLAAIVEPILHAAGERAARNFERRASDPAPGANTPRPTWSAPPPAALLDVEALTREIKRKTDPVVLAFGEQIMTEILGAPPLNAAGVAISWETTNPLVGRAKADTGAQITNIAETTRGDVMKAINDSYDEGLSIPNTADRIREKMREASPGRATLIARTEMTRTVNASSLASVEMVDNATGQAHYKVWLTAAGAKHPRHERYAGLNGQTRPLKAAFDVNGSAMQAPGDPAGPAHETCNCRCALGYSENPSGGDLAGPEGDFTIDGLIGDNDTFSKYTDPATGAFTPERQKLHQRIVNEMIEDARAQENPEAVFMAGGSGSGKSSLGLKDPPHSVRIDPDWIKERIPEYQGLIDAGRAEDAARLVHEESSFIARQAMTLAKEQHYSVVVDGTGDANPGKFLSKIQELKEAGYEAKVIYVDIPTKTALERAEGRFQRAIAEGRAPRKVQEAMIRNIHRDVAARFKNDWRLSDDVDFWQLWDNTGKTPVLVAERHAGGEIKVFKRKLYNAVLKKADEKVPPLKQAYSPAMRNQVGRTPGALTAKEDQILGVIDAAGRDTTGYVSLLTTYDQNYNIIAAAQVRRLEKTGYDYVHGYAGISPAEEQALIRAAAKQARDDGQLLGVWNPTAAQKRWLRQMGFEQLPRGGVYDTWIGDDRAIRKLLGETTELQTVGEHFTNWETLTKTSMRGRTTLEATKRSGDLMGRVFTHYGEDVPKIDLIVDTGQIGTNTMGHYRPRQSAIRTGTEQEITMFAWELDAAGASPMTTFIHEFGHYIDEHHLPRWRIRRTDMANFYRSEGLPEELQPWWDAVNSTEQVQRLRVLFEGAGPSNRPTLQYLLTPRELWARAFAQYVTFELRDQAINHPDLFSDDDRGLILGACQWLSRMTQPEYGQQWSEEEFAPIRREMDKIFRGLGWLRTVA